jgi:hypothetical protein
MLRTLIEPHKGDKRYVRRKKGKFTKSRDDVEAVLLWLIAGNPPSISGEGESSVTADAKVNKAF